MCTCTSKFNAIRSSLRSAIKVCIEYVMHSL